MAYVTVDVETDGASLYPFYLCSHLHLAQVWVSVVKLNS